MLEMALWRMLRELLDITGEDVAKLMHCTKQTVSNIETGRCSSEMSSHLYITTMQSLIDRDREKVGMIKVTLEEMLDFLGEL